MHWIAETPDMRAPRVLEVATGAGRTARVLAESCAEVTAIDREAHPDWADAPANLRFATADAEALPFADGAFDLAVIAWSLHHLANPTRVLLEMRRVLAPGGRLVIAEPIDAPQGTNGDGHTAAHQLLARLDRLRGRDHFPLYARLQVGSVIQGLGLTELGFHPVLANPAEADWDLARCQAAAAPWIRKLEEAIAEPATPAPARAEARTLAERLRAEGLRTGPMMVVSGRVPGARG